MKQIDEIETPQELIEKWKHCIPISELDEFENDVYDLSLNSTTSFSYE
jgi:hypothetical protein